MASEGSHPGDEVVRELSDDERAFDAYLARALDGAAPAPAEFAASASGELRSALERIYRRARGSGASSDELPFERLGDYRLIRRLGGGGMGLVFLAEQESLGREVALKIVRPELQGSAVAAERFQREARAVAQLRHPNIVAVFAAGEERGVRYLVMELIEGANLDELVKRGELAAIPLARRVRWIAELARALDFAHSRGVIHRDVKSANVRITREGRALLLDFGLARTTESGAATLTDGFAGSPSFASPEQIAKGAELDLRTDVYSLGVTLYQVATGVAPFEGASVEQVFHRILTAAPTPPRKLEPSIPRDLETVVLKAMERDPRRRYATAGEFADDLEAVLDLRPIRGRPPSALERLRRAGRRRPVLATAAATGVFAAIVLTALFIAQRSVRRAEQRDEALRSVAAARARIADYRTSRDSLQGLLYQVDNVRKIQQYQYLDAEQYALLDKNERRLEELQRAWEATFYEVLDLLRQAERLDPEVAGTESVRAELHYERYREARELRDEGAMKFNRGLVLAHDAGGQWAQQLAGELSMSLETDPPGAEVFLLRYVELAELVPDGDPREVLVPLRDAPSAVAPGSWALRVVEPSGELRRGDLIVEIAGQPIEGTTLVARAREPVACADRLLTIDGQPAADDWALSHLGAPAKPSDDGRAPEKSFEFARADQRLALRGASLAELGLRVLTAADFAADGERCSVPAKVFRNGAVLALALPPGVDVRATATPEFMSPACSIGHTPIEHLALPSAAYLAVLHLDGYEDRRVTIRSIESDWRFPKIVLTPVGTTPRGFVHIDDPKGDFWIQEHEVTAAEYLEFLEDPTTQIEIDLSPTRVLVPRENVEQASGPLWERRSDGSFVLPRDWTGDWPVLGISWDDAVAYAHWRTQRAQERGLDYEYALPTYLQYLSAGVGRLNWSYTWGSRFRAKWARTCFARPSPSPGRVMQFPIDQSPFGVFDMCGSAFEWLDHWYDEGRGFRQLGGGSWGHSDPGIISIPAGYGSPPQTCSGAIGMRLALRIGRKQAR